MSFFTAAPGFQHEGMRPERMKLILKYLRPFAGTVAICFLFLFAQSACYLSLPTMMSDIVNVGISQSGIEETVPQALTEDGMALLLPFLDTGEQSLFLAGYTLVQPQSEQAQELEDQYPALQEQPVYLLTATDKTVLAQLEALYAHAGYGARLYLSGQAEQAEEQLQLRGADLTAALRQLETDEAGVQAYRDAAAQVEEETKASTGIALLQPLYEQLGLDLDRMQMSYIVTMGIWMLLVALLSVLFALLASLLASRIAAAMARDMRHDIFRKVTSFSSAEFSRFSTASLITRTTNDVEQIQTIVFLGLRLLIFSLMMGVGGVIFAVRTSVTLSWIIALSVVGLIGLVLVIFVIAVPKFKALQGWLDRLNLVGRETLTGLLVIRAFGNERHEQARFDSANMGLTRINRFIQRAIAFLVPLMTILMNVLLLIIVWVGTGSIANSTLQVGSMMAFLDYTLQIMTSFLMLAVLFILVPRAAVSTERIGEILHTESKIKDPEDPIPLGKVEGFVEFRHVNYRYADADADVLKDISFMARPGETTAFIGSTGSGKSTLVNLIPRFDDVTEGAITVDGVDIRKVALRELRGNIGYVPQKGTLFSGDIASNLRYGDEAATEEEMQEAVTVAQAKEFVDQNGLSTPIAQGGGNVSGGQKQRLSIARALMKKAPIYIFDDSFSALDFQTDLKLRQALKEKTGGATVLIVAQRINTILHADQIVVLDQGTIAGIGDHQTLMETCQVYREIAESQLTKEELECQNQ